MAATATPDTDVSADTAAEIDAIFGDKYKVIVHNDDVTTFATVITALVQLFDHTVEEAEELAHQVDSTGRAVVAVLSKDEAAAGVTGLHSFKIQASMEEV